MLAPFTRAMRLASYAPRYANAARSGAGRTGVVAAGRFQHTGATCAPPEGAERVGAGIGRQSNMVLVRGEGCWVWNSEGEKYLDFATGIGVTSLGHCHPKVKAAIHDQVDKIWHAQVNIAHHEPMMHLTANLQKAMPKDSGLDTFLFVTSGSEAVESAVKLARHATGKPNIIVLQGGYHGRTLLTMSMTTSKTIYRGGYGPHAAGIHVTPFPYYFERNGPALEDPTAWTLEHLDLLMTQQTTPGETAAIVVEPVLGEGGYVPLPPGLLAGLRKYCDKQGMLLVADEVQSGFGRTGKMFAVEHSEVHPDILVFAKGIATGMPIAGIASRRELMAKQPAGSQGGTYAGNAVACAAANATITTILEDGVLANVVARGAQMTEALLRMQKDGVAPIREVRGPGLMIGLDFDTKRVSKGFAGKLAKECLTRGMIVLPTGVYETMRLIPPLIVSEEECTEGLAILEAAMKEVMASE